MQIESKACCPTLDLHGQIHFETLGGGGLMDGGQKGDPQIGDLYPKSAIEAPGGVNILHTGQKKDHNIEDWCCPSPILPEKEGRFCPLCAEKMVLNRVIRPHGMGEYPRF